MKKIISLLLCVVMLTVCLAGCGSSPAAEAPAASAEPAASADTAAPEGEATSDTEELPFVELTWYCVGNQQSNPEPVFEKVNEYLKEKLRLKDYEIFIIDLSRQEIM